MPSDDAPPAETRVLDYEPGEEEREWPDEPSELPPRRRRRLLAPVPLALSAVLLIACGFIAGVQVQKGQGSSGTSTTAGLASRFAAFAARGTGAAAGRSGAGGLPAGAGAGGFGAGASAGGPLTTGEVSYVRGNTIYVADSQGNTVRVSAAAGSKVTKTVSTKASAIHPGERVVVIGTQAKNGSISARSISVGAGESSSGAASSTSSSSSTSESGTPALFGPG